MDNKTIMEMLKAPFKPEEIQWRIGRKTKDKSKAEAMAYIDARAVMDRLDEVVGADRWEVEYVPVDMGTMTINTFRGEETEYVKGFMCKITLHLSDGDVVRMDGANCTDFSPFKGGLTGALRRTASALGIGRYLYNIPSQWVPIDQWGNFTETPKLPSWALPGVTTDDLPTQEVVPPKSAVDAILTPKPGIVTPGPKSETGEVIFTKGKFSGKPVSSVTDHGYLKWVVESSRFPEEVKAAASKVLADHQAEMYDDEPDEFAAGF